MRQVHLATPLVELVRRAGAAILERQAPESAEMAYKADASPVTAADLASHEVLTVGLRALWPEIPIVSEEAIATEHVGDTFWLVDPLDGTKEFLRGSGEYTVNVALIENGLPVLGVVYAPALKLLYWGGKGWGAWRSLAGQVTPISVSVAHVPLRVVASRSHLDDKTCAFIAQLGAVQLVQAGSSLKFCRLAEGEADCYPRLAPTCEWDTAAAQAVLEGAGGWVLDEAGMPLCYGKSQWRNAGFVAWGYRG